MGLGGAEETSSFMSEFIRKCGGCVVIDGGFATELERHGADLNDPLWSAKCLIDSPHLVRRVHSLSLSLSLSLSFFLFGSCERKGKKEIFSNDFLFWVLENICRKKCLDSQIFLFFLVGINEG
jgi:hypothetical protein